MLTPNPGLIIWTIVTFVLLAIVLRKFAWKPILEALRSREESIESSIERAEFAKSEAERILAENREQLARAESESRRMLAEGRTLGEQLKNDLLDQANQQSRKLLEQAKQEIARDKEAALTQLRGEVANLAIKVAEKILDESLDENKHRKIIEGYLKELPKN